MFAPRLTREGLAEGLIADLPKDELLSIAGYQEILDQRYDIVHTGDGGILKICTAVLRMNEHDCRIYYRLLWEQVPAGGYRDECMPYLSGANLIGEPYVQLLFETNDETFFMDPLSLERTGETIRIEYRVLPHVYHQRLLVAVKSQMEPHLIYGLFHIHRESFFLYPYQESVLSADENTVYYGETAGYDRYHTFWRIEEAGEPAD